MNKHYGKVEDVLELINKDPKDLGLQNQEQLEKLVEKLLTKISSHINARLAQRKVYKEDVNYPAICDIAERKILDMIAIIQQVQSGDIVSMDELSTRIINTTDVMSNLDEELRAFHKRRIRLSW